MRGLPDSHQDAESETGWRFSCDWCGRELVVEVRTLQTAIALLPAGWQHKACGVDWCGRCDQQAARNDAKAKAIGPITWYEERIE